MNRIKWFDTNGKVISCNEKIKVMNQNIEEVCQLMQYLLEDGILMGIDECQIKSVLQQIVSQLENPYNQNIKE